jgi:hypothetical protein
MLVTKSQSNNENDLRFTPCVPKYPHVAEPGPVILDPIVTICLAVFLRASTFPSSAFVKFEIFECCKSARSL